MEATCFVTTNSFTKTTIELVSPIKPRTPPTFPKRNSIQLGFTKARNPSSISCCHFESSKPYEDGHKLSNDVDWRSFRARLVAGERASRPMNPSSLVDLDNVVDHHPPQITLGEKWAHAIHKPEKGCLLIATDKLDGVHIFERAVILLLSIGPVDPTGIIINRPSLMSIKETKSTVFDVSGTFSDRPLFFGGPLEEGLFLVNPRKNGDDVVRRSGVFDEVMEGLYFGTKESVGCAAEMVKRNIIGLGDIRFFDGYCVWDNEQLKDEIRAGYWTVAACSPSVIGFGLPRVGNVGLWEEVHGLIGPKNKKVW